MPDYVWVALVALIYAIKEWFDRQRDDRLNAKVEIIKEQTNHLTEALVTSEKKVSRQQGKDEQIAIQEQVRHGVDRIVGEVGQGVEKVVSKEVKEGVEQVVEVVEQGVEKVADQVVQKVKEAKEG